MVPEWQIRQQLYARSHPDHDDIINPDHVVIVPVDSWTITSYFETKWFEIMQPVKSYAVAIVYARLLEKRFGEHFIEALNYPDLLLGDRYFSRYCDDWRTYDSVFALLRERKLWDFENNNLPQVKATVSYFKKEFLLI